MTTNKRVRLAFKKRISLAQQQSRIFAQMLTNDLADFAPDFPHFTSSYITAFEALITTAETTQSTDDVKDAIKALTADVKLKVKEAKDWTQQLYTYVELAWPNDEVKLSSYGSGRKYEEALRHRPDLIKLMEEAYEKANSAVDKPILAGKGWGNTKLSSLNNAKNALRTADKLLGVAANDVKAKTDAYYTAQNNMWAIVKEINKAAQVVYANNPAKRSAYMLNPEAESSTGLAITLDIADSETPAVHHFTVTLTPSQSIYLKMLEGNGAAFACFGPSASGPWTSSEKSLNPGEEALYTFADFGASGPYLRIRQVGTLPMKVRVKLPGE